MRITNRLVLGTVAERLESVADALPANPADISGVSVATSRIASELPALANVLRTLVDEGAAAAWLELQRLDGGSIR